MAKGLVEAPQAPISALELEAIHALNQKVQWLSAWMIHHANHIRPSRDGLKVGGHQASSASLNHVMTALYFSVLRPEDRVAVKPHASPVFHAIQYLLGNQSLDQIQNFRALGGAQSYPSRTKDKDDVDFSTGSVGLGVAATLFASLAQDYLLSHGLIEEKDKGRMVALMGDAELDEGNIYEALIEGYKHDLRNCWWVIDYNRQSLDNVTSDRMFTRFTDIFHTTGWEVVTLKYGKKQQAAFGRPGGEALRTWIDACPNSLYSALTYKGGAAWREHILSDIGHKSALKTLVNDFDDEGLQELMTNLGGHDLELLLETFHSITSDQPHCFLAYTVKGYGLPFQGHKDNHAGLMNKAQMGEFQASMNIKEGEEWAPFAGLGVKGEKLQHFLSKVPFNTKGPRRKTAQSVPVEGDIFPSPQPGEQSTQVAFGRILNEIAKGDSALANRIITTSPDVTVSTNLGGFVNQRGIFARQEVQDVFKEENVLSPQKWVMTPKGQHLELGIAENNLFLALGAFGLSGSLWGERLLPIGTLYDPFIARGLDALNYACYQDARFMLVATPAGVSLAPEGGAHQSFNTPPIGMAQPGLTYFEPAYVDELTEIMRWGFDHMQASDGGSIYLRLSTRALKQPIRTMNDDLKADILNGGYWEVKPSEGAELAIIYTGVLASEARSAFDMILEDIPGAGLLNVTSPDLLNKAWIKNPGGSHVDKLLGALDKNAVLICVIDGAPIALSWLGSVHGQRTISLGVSKFGQSADIPDIYAVHEINADAILTACARACLLN